MVAPVWAWVKRTGHYIQIPAFDTVIDIPDSRMVVRGLGKKLFQDLMPFAPGRKAQGNPKGLGRLKSP